MRRVALVAALAVVLLPAFAAEPSLAPTPDALAANATPEGTFRATLTKNGNVRFAPTTQAKIIVTLPARTEVEILAPAKVPGWYVIRFPREGLAWVHSKVLQSVDGGKRWRVIEDKARARDDSTLGAGIVAELSKGEVLEDKGRINGDWRAVTLPNAVAYVSGQVLELPSDIDGARKQSGERAAAAAAVWTAAQATYANYYDSLQKNPQNALTLDWDGLSKQLDLVIHDHADTDTRVAAQRMRDGIVNVAAQAANVAKAKGLGPVSVPSAIPTVPTSVTTPVVTATTQTPAIAAGAIDHGDPTKPALLTVPEQQTSLVVPLPVPEVKPQPAAVVTPVVPAKPFVVEGFVTQQKFEAIGVTDVLVDADSNVVAFLKIPVGKDIQLSEYVWRWVGVRGEVQDVDPAKHNLGRKVPLVIVDELALAH
jgi:Bacterial SH3 domain